MFNYNKLVKKIERIASFLVIFVLMIAWIFSGWPPVLSFAQEATPTSSDQTVTSTLDGNPSEEEISNPAPELPLPQSPALKERKLNKEVRIDKSASHQCIAKNFTINLSSGQNSAAIEILLVGKRGVNGENLEIGSLPLGIDITFLNNSDYLYSPPNNSNVLILQIINQSGSQKGNFSVPIIYISGNSTTICQINVINF